MSSQIPTNYVSQEKMLVINCLTSSSSSLFVEDRDWKFGAGVMKRAVSTRLWLCARRFLQLFNHSSGRSWKVRMRNDDALWKWITTIEMASTVESSALFVCFQIWHTWLCLIEVYQSIIELYEQRVRKRKTLMIQAWFEAEFGSVIQAYALSSLESYAEPRESLKSS